jgi:hypothetical protein
VVQDFIGSIVKRHHHPAYDRFDMGWFWRYVLGEQIANIAYGFSSALPGNFVLS